ncbi:MAG TPA: aspartyl protease family protein [Candidatus Paceibacterota bacterium]|nr:aspartyl protease family protein [Candidatus Paceibacterota bacterium]
MSTHNKYYYADGQTLSPELLRQEGPTIDVAIEAPEALADALRKQGKSLSPQKGKALIDTGASSSVVDESVIKALQVNAIGKRTVYSVGSEVEEMDTYPAKFSFPGSTLPQLDFSSVTASPYLQKQGLIALIGRDILQYGTLIYHGNGHFTLVLDPNQKVERGVIVYKENSAPAPSAEISNRDNKAQKGMDW